MATRKRTASTKRMTQPRRKKTTVRRKKATVRRKVRKGTMAIGLSKVRRKRKEDRGQTPSQIKISTRAGAALR